MCFSTKTPKRRGGTLLQISVCGGYGAPCPPPLPRSGAYGEFFVQLQDVVHYVKLYEISVLRLCSHHIPESFSCRLGMRIRYTVNSNSTELEQVVYKHQSNCTKVRHRTFPICDAPRSRSAAQLRSVTETTPKISGGSRGGARGPRPPLFLYQTEARWAEKNFLETEPPPLSKDLDDHPPPLISRSKSPFFHVNRGPILYGFSAAANANRYSVNVSLIKLPLHRIYTEIILPFFSSIFRLICCGL